MIISLSGIEVRLPGSAGHLFRLPALEVASGARVLIHGPSGRGKTTLLHVIAGQFLPHAGSVRLGDTDLTALDENARADFRRDRLGIIFQRWNLIDHLTVLENVMLGIPKTSRSARRGREGFTREALAREALRRTGLEDLAGRPGGLLSPGEQQRAAVARVWASSPAIILADEPTSSLDGPGAERVLDALWEASEPSGVSRGSTLLVVSHDPRARVRFDDVRDFGELIAPGAAPMIDPRVAP